MECINCGSHLEPNWTHCPHCGKFKSVLKEPLTDEAVDGIFSKLFGRSKEAKSSSKASYGSGVREQVFEVIVRQALAGAPWREICAGPMQVNNIDPKDVQEEVDRRLKVLDSQSYKKDKTQKGKDAKKSKESGKEEPPQEGKPPRSVFNRHDEEPVSPPRPLPDCPEGWEQSTSLRLQALHRQMSEFLDNALRDQKQKDYGDKLLSELEEIVNSILRLETLLQTIRNEIESSSSFERELGRTTKRIDPDKPGGPHRIDW